jgi:hypothetical protein
VAVLSLLPLLLAFVAYAAIAKLAARLFRRTKLSWRASLLLALGVFLASALIGIVVRPSGVSPWLALPLGIALHIVVAAWFFSRFAKTADDATLNPIAAVKLAGLLAGLSAIFAGVMALLATVLLRASS